MNKNKVHLFLSIIAGLGLGLALTYAFNANAVSSLTASLTVEKGAIFNVNYIDDNKVFIQEGTGNIGVGTTSVDPN